MPVISTASYSKPLWNHNFYLPDNNIANLYRDVVTKNDYSSLKTYLENGNDLNKPIYWEYAIQYKSEYINPGKITTVVFNGNATLLHLLVLDGNVDLIKFLTTYDVDFNQNATFDGTFLGWKPIDGTPLHLLANYKDSHWGKMEVLLDNGAKPNLTNTSGLDVLDVAEKVESKEIAGKLEAYLATHHMDNLDPISYETYLAQKNPAATTAPSQTSPMDIAHGDNGLHDKPNAANNSTTKDQNWDVLSWISDVLTNKLKPIPMDELFEDQFNQMNLDYLRIENQQPALSSSPALPEPISNQPEVVQLETPAEAYWG